jgi:rhamnogalacturonyl hydrolase YesR
MDNLQIATSGALSLVKLQLNDGSFRYRYDSRDNRSLKGYNVLRHAGAIWCLLDVYNEIEDSRILECARRSVCYLLNTSLRFFRDPQNVCICEHNTIKLGGNALSALALLSLYEVTGNAFLLSISEELCRFMLSQRAEHGMFVHKRYFRSGKISDFQSMYYTGEALLAMLALYRITGEKKMV